MLSPKFKPFNYSLIIQAKGYSLRYMSARGIRYVSTNSTQGQLGAYLAGLIEGDGSIILRKGDSEKISPKIVFTFGKNDLPMYERLKKILNTGSIYIEKNGVCRYSITSSDAVIRVINLVNGKFRTPKIEVLYKAIDNLNKWRDAKLLKLPLDTSSIDSNAWLAGFIDTDGHFSIKLTGEYKLDDYKTRGRVQCVFSVNQCQESRLNGESNVPFMSKIAEYFNVNLCFKEQNLPSLKGRTKRIDFYVQADSKHYLIVSYLTKYPLMSSKWLNYLLYLKGLKYLGKRLSREEIIEIRAIKNSMNTKRTEFNWNHLDNYYLE